MITVKGIYIVLISGIFVMLTAIIGECYCQYIERKDIRFPLKKDMKTIVIESLKSFVCEKEDICTWIVILTTYIVFLHISDNGLWFAIYLSFLLGIGATIDKQCFILPDEILYLLISLGGLHLIVYSIPFSEAMISMVMGGAFLLALRVISSGGVGWGDIKWTTAIGLWLTWQEMLVMLILAFTMGSIYVLFRKKNKEKYIPFGPFLCVGTLFTYLHGKSILEWYSTFFLVICDVWEQGDEKIK